jgi:hypothetical protein
VKRTLMVLAVALVMVANMAVMGAPAFAAGKPSGVPPAPGTGGSIGEEQCFAHFKGPAALPCPDRN